MNNFIEESQKVQVTNELKIVERSLRWMCVVCPILMVLTIIAGIIVIAIPMKSTFEPGQPSTIYYALAIFASGIYTYFLHMKIADSTGRRKNLQERIRNL